MIDRSTWIHLRFPFSFFLAPIALFGFSEAMPPLDPLAAPLIFIILHGLLYPASNGFNSYFDRDEGSIGGIEHPPVATRSLLVWSLLFDVLAVALGTLVSLWFALIVCVYGLLSKAYSWDRIRLKRRPVISWLGVGLVQGGLTFLSVAVFGGAARPPLSMARLWSGALAISLLYLAGYPLTQVYQHDEDRRRGDRTISMLCGVRGTFILCAILFAAAAAAFVFHYVLVRHEAWRAGLFFACQVPLAGCFLDWARRVWREPAAATYRYAMRMNLVTAIVMSVFFVGMVLIS